MVSPYMHQGFTRFGFLFGIKGGNFIPRVPNRPVINTAIVSAAVHSEGPPLPLILDPPITLEYSLLETEERTKPVCVFWNHSIACVWTPKTPHRVPLSLYFIFFASSSICRYARLGSAGRAVGPPKAARCWRGTTATLAVSVTT